VSGVRAADASLPSGVEVVAAPPEQEPVLANLLELYAYDLSAFFYIELGPDGRFGYPALPLYWKQESRFPFLVRVEGRLAGLVLVSRGSRIGWDPEVWDMAEFFVLRRYRKQGIGAAVAREVWRRFPGTWEVRVLERNAPALAFWAAAIRNFTGSPAEPAAVEIQGKRWQVFRFEASSPGQREGVEG
jgi:predicted acetyltransferase